MSKKEKILKWVVYFSNKALDIHFKKEIRQINKQASIDELSVHQKKEILEYFKKFGFSNINTDWHKFYLGITSNFDKRYLPKDLFYSKIEPSLNRKSMYPAYLDKNLMSKLFDFVEQPKTIIKNINGYFYSDQDKLIGLREAIRICSGFLKLVIKPTIETGGGKNVRLFKNTEIEKRDQHDSIKKLLDSYKKDFILQEVIVQNDQMKSLNESSVNTIRVMSYLNDDGVQILSSVVRVGNKGKFTDNNSHLGGISCGITSTGKLKSIGYNEIGEKYEKTDFGCVLEAFKIPYYAGVISIVDKLHRAMPHFRLISWDLAIDNLNRIVLIEYNLEFQGVEIHQLNNGPLFGKLTACILKEIK